MKETVRVTESALGEQTRKISPKVMNWVLQRVVLKGMDWVLV